MADPATPPADGAAGSGQFARASDGSVLQRFFRATEIDTRMLGMLGALLLIWIVFHLFSDGRFLTPRNLWNLSVQTASVAVMSTGMVLIIVTRHIDLSVGSILGFVAMVMGVTQANLLPELIGAGNGATWAIALAVGIVLGGLIGAMHGYVIAFLGVPAFIVTLGGLLVWRGAAWWVTSGQTVAPMDTERHVPGGSCLGRVRGPAPGRRGPSHRSSRCPARRPDPCRRPRRRSRDDRDHVSGALDRKSVV